MKKQLLPLFVVIVFSFMSCKKQAGEGGTSSITGRILERKYNPYFSVFYGQYAATDKTVYIIYGDETSYGNNIKTGPDGYYEFKYLRKGNYKIYTYSNDSTNTVGHYDSVSGTWNPPANPNAPKMSVIKSVEITKNHQMLDAGYMTIFN